MDFGQIYRERFRYPFSQSLLKQKMTSLNTIYPQLRSNQWCEYRL